MQERIYSNCGSKFWSRYSTYPKLTKSLISMSCVCWGLDNFTISLPLISRVMALLLHLYRIKLAHLQLVVSLVFLWKEEEEENGEMEIEIFIFLKHDWEWIGWICIYIYLSRTYFAPFTISDRDPCFDLMNWASIV